MLFVSSVSKTGRTVRPVAASKARKTGSEKTWSTEVYTTTSGELEWHAAAPDPAATATQAHLTDPLTLSSKSSVSAAQYDMREARRAFGVVVDRWGNCVGVVTVKDLVEEIVGELAAW